jgi:hypothetical protein
MFGEGGGIPAVYFKRWNALLCYRASSQYRAAPDCYARTDHSFGTDPGSGFTPDGFPEEFHV